MMWVPPLVSIWYRNKHTMHCGVDFQHGGYFCTLFALARQIFLQSYREYHSIIFNEPRQEYLQLIFYLQKVTSSGNSLIKGEKELHNLGI